MTENTAPLILIVDDNEQNAKLARDVLRAAGFRTIEAATGAEAFVRATRDRPSVILMDLRLPDGTVATVARQLKSDARTAAIPVVALTALAPADVREWSVEASFDGYLEKPINVEEFPNEVRRFVGGLTVLRNRGAGPLDGGSSGWHARLSTANNVERGDVMRTLLTGCALALAMTALAGCGSSKASTDEQTVAKDAAYYQIDQIEQTWHRAASHHDVNLMMTLWAPGAVFNVGEKTLHREGSDPELLRNGERRVHAAAPLGVRYAVVQDSHDRPRRQGDALLRVPLRRHQDGEGRRRRGRRSQRAEDQRQVADRGLCRVDRLARMMKCTPLAGCALLVATAALAGCGSSATSAPRQTIQKDATLYQIDMIERTFHRAMSTHNVNLMMDLFAPGAVFNLGLETFSGKAQIRKFFATKNLAFQPGTDWESDTPSYKIKVTVNGDKARSISNATSST